LNIKDREPNQKTLLILCISIFLVSLVEILQEHYKGLPTEAMLVYGNGCRNTHHKRYQIKEKKINEFIIDEN